MSDQQPMPIPDVFTWGILLVRRRFTREVGVEVGRWAYDSISGLVISRGRHYRTAQVLGWIPLNAEQVDELRRIKYPNLWELLHRSDAT